MPIPSNLPQKYYIKAMWSLEGNSNDRSRYAHNGTDTNITYNTSYGKIKQGASLNGSTSKIVISDHSDLKPTGKFSVAAWFKTSTGARRVIFSSWSRNPNTAGIVLQISDTNKLSGLLGKNGAGYGAIHSNTTITDGVWRHGVFTWDSSKLYMYINGSSDASPVNWADSPAYAATNYVRIGCRNDTGTDIYFFNGYIDEVILWNGVCLSPTEVSKLYNISVYQTGEFFNFF